MKRIVFALLSIFVAWGALAATYKSVDEIKMVYLEDETRYVCNPDGILSQGTVNEIDAMLRCLEDSTSIQVVVVAVEKIEGGDCFRFATDLGNKYGVGQKSTNNGLVVLLSTQDRCIQFSTGSGLEGYLPDAICDRIQRHYMLDALGKEKWDEGMYNGIQAVCGYLDGSMKPEIDDEKEDNNWGFPIIFFCLPFAMSWWSYRKQKKCPKCGKYKLKHTGSQTLAENSAYKRVEELYVCKHCGHNVSRRSTISKQVSSGGFHRHSGGGFSGGGGRGGSFGGGHFGGGGRGFRF